MENELIEVIERINKNLKDTYESLFAKFNKRNPLFASFGRGNFESYYNRNFWSEYEEVSKRNFTEELNDIMNNIFGGRFRFKTTYTEKKNGFRITSIRDRSLEAAIAA